MLPLGELRASFTNVRRRLDKAKLGELADSIRTQGQLEPAIVRPTATAGVYEVVAGNRRFAAQVELKAPAMPCIVRQLNDNEAAQIQTVENLQREDLTPLEEAAGYDRLRRLNRDGKGRPATVAAVAKLVGKSARYVYARLQLQGLQTSAKQLLDQGKITASVAQVLVAMPADVQGALAQRFSVQAAPTVQELRAEARRIQAARRPAAQVRKARERARVNARAERELEARRQVWRKALARKTPRHLEGLELRALLSAVQGKAPAGKAASWYTSRLWAFAAAHMDPALLPAVTKRYKVHQLRAAVARGRPGKRAAAARARGHHER